MPLTTTAPAYDEIAERWRDQEFDPHNGLVQHERALRFLGAEGDGWALNVGCGCNTRFNSLMCAHHLHIEGIDVSGRMIELARQADPTLSLHHADVCAWQLPRTYRFITAWDSIWHVALKDQRPLMLKLMHALEVGGVFIFTAGGLDAEDEHTDAYMGPELNYSTLGIPGLLNVIAEAGCICRHLELDQYPQKHLTVIVQRV